MSCFYSIIFIKIKVDFGSEDEKVLPPKISMDLKNLNLTNYEKITINNFIHFTN
jgi:hypothetical protein